MATKQAKETWAMRSILNDAIVAGFQPIRCESTSDAGEGQVTEVWYEPPAEMVVTVEGHCLAEFTIPPKYVPDVGIEYEYGPSIVRGTYHATLTRFDDRFRRATYYCEIT